MSRGPTGSPAPDPTGGRTPGPTRDRSRGRQGGLGPALAGGASLIALVVVVPIILWSIGGWPPAHLGYGQLSRDLSGRNQFGPHLMTAWMLRGALVLAWISWLWMTVCIVVELGAWRSGSRPVRLPGSRSMQSAAAFLIGTTLAVSVLSRSVPVTPLPVALSATGMPVPTIRVIDDTDPGNTRPLPASNEVEGHASEVGGPPGVGRPRHSVTLAYSDPGQRRTTLPVLDEHLVVESAPGSRPEVHPDLEPVIVAGSVAEPDSGPDRKPEPEPVARPSAPANRVDRATGRSPGTHLVATRETLWSIASDRLGAPLRWKEIAALNYGHRQPDGGQLGADHWIQPGWVLVLPGQHGPVSRGGQTLTSVPTGSPAAVGSPTEPPSATPARPVPVPVVPVGGSIVGAGVVSILDRMRRAQQRHRAEGALIHLPDPRQKSVEERLRVGDGMRAATTVDATVTMFHQWRRSTGCGVTQLLGARLHDDEIELIVDPVEIEGGTVPPFVVAGSGRSVVVDRGDVPLPTSGSHGTAAMASPAPLLVTAGRADDETIMVNLEPLGSLVVQGGSTETEGVLRSLALELATSFWASQFELVLVGFGDELERFTRVRSTVDVAPLVDQLCTRRIAARARLGAAGYASFAEARARARAGAERWDPLVVICGSSVPAVDVGEILEAGADAEAGMVVIATGAQRGSSRMVTWSSEHSPSTLDFLATVVEPQAIDDQELVAVTSLLETARSREAMFTSDEPYVHLPVPLPDADHRLPSGLRSAPTVSAGAGVVEVSVLGPVEIRGAAREFTRAWAKELVVYLAMHPRGAANDAWAAALWPDRLMAASSLHSTASVARRALGQGPDGGDHLPRSHGRLALSPTVVTDWHRFVELADTGQAEQWRAALALVRGRLFDGLRSSDWPILEGIAPSMEASIVDLSGRLAGHSLSSGDPRGAEWSARQGLLVSPYDERLYRMLMRAADAAGHPAGVEAAMEELVTLVADDIEPFDSVHPSTMALYRSLTRRRKRSTR